MQLSVIIAVLLAISAAEAAPETPVGLPWVRTTVVVLSGFLMDFLAQVGTCRLETKLTRHPDQAVR